MKRTLWLVAAITLVAFILRLYRLDFVSLRGDESFTVVFVQRTWEGLWKGIRLIEPNPPLMYLVLRVWVALAGASEFVTRYFSAFFGVLCVPLLYRLARELWQFSAKGLRPDQQTAARIGLIAALLIAINPYQVWHSQDVRNYTLWPALSLLSLVFLWRWMRGEFVIASPRSLRAKQSPLLTLALYTLVATASLYTHYYDTFILVAENLFVFSLALFYRRWRMLTRWIGAQVVLAVVYLPWVLFGTNRITTYGEASAQQNVPVWEQFSRTLTAFVVGDTVPDTAKSVLWLPLVLGLVGALVYWARRDREQAGFVALCIVVPTLALYVISVGRPLFLERYLNGVAPAYYLAFAVGLERLARWASLWGTAVVRPTAAQLAQVAPIALGVLFFGATSAYALGGYYFDPAYAKAPDWRSLTQYIVAHRQPGDFVIQNYTEMSIVYYVDGVLPVMTLPKDFWARLDDEQKLEELNAQYHRLWFIPAAPDFWDPDHFVENYLSRRDDRLTDLRFADLRLQLYATPSEFRASIVPLNARIGNATLVGYRVQDTRPLRVVLYWQTAQLLERDYTVFVHLADAGDRVRAQHDGAPVSGGYPTRAWRPGELIVDGHDLPAEIAPGAYTLFVGMYDPATMGRVPALDSNGTPLPNDRVALTQVTIP